MPVRRSARTRALLLALAAAAAVLVACVATAEEVDRGRDLLPYRSSEVVQYEVLGGLTVYVERETAMGWDQLNAGLFGLIALTAGAGWWMLRRRPDSKRPRRVLGGMAIVVLALALDEVLALHETAGHNLRFLADLPGIERPDDAIVVLGALVLLAAGAACWRTFASAPAALGVFALAGIAGVVAALSDPLDITSEEQLEVVATCLVLAGTVLLVRSLVRERSSAPVA